jgi:MFS family permease
VAVTLIGLFAMIVGGIFFDKVFKGKARPAIAIGFVLSGLFAYIILSPAVYGSMGVLVLCLMIAGWGIPFMNPSITAFVAMNYPPAILGRMIGWVFGVGTFGGALGLYLGGNSIGATGSFKMAITMISLAAIVGLVLSFFLKARQA